MPSDYIYDNAANNYCEDEDDYFTKMRSLLKQT